MQAVVISFLLSSEQKVPYYLLTIPTKISAFKYGTLGLKNDYS